MEQLKPEFSRSQSALIGGASLLLIAIIAPIAIFGILAELFDPLNAGNTFQNLQNSKNQFRIAIALLLIITILEVIVPWAFYIFFKPVNDSLSLLTAWFRLMYTAIFGASVLNLFHALKWIEQQSGSVSPDMLSAQTQMAIENFYDGWNFSLAVFGIHLILLGILAIRAGYMKKILGILILISGMGYSVDGFGKILSEKYSVEVSAFTFAGEVILIFWLLIKGRKL